VGMFADEIKAAEAIRGHSARGLLNRLSRHVG